MSKEQKSVPDYFLCKMTYNVLNQPVIAADGLTYEYQAIFQHFKKGYTTSPSTGAKLDHLYLKQNQALKQAIKDYFEKQQTPQQTKHKGQQFRYLEEIIKQKNAEVEELKKNSLSEENAKLIQKLKMNLEEQSCNNKHLTTKIEELTTKIEELNSVIKAKDQQNQVLNKKVNQLLAKLDENSIKKQPNKQQVNLLEIQKMLSEEIKKDQKWNTLNNLVLQGHKLNQIKQLHISYANISDLKWFSCMVSLKLLNLYACHIAKIEHLQTLQMLQNLGLQSNKIKMVENLQNLAALSKVNLLNNPIVKTNSNDQAVERLRKKKIKVDI